MRVLGSLAGLAGAAALLAACGGGQDEAAAPAAQTATAPAEDPQVLLASLPAPYNTADLENGRKTFGLCRSCHTLPQGGSDMTGPNLHGVFGRTAGTHGDYKYSEPLKASAIVWDGPKVDAWIENPKAVVPGTKMVFMGVKDPKDRTDLIAYLMTQTK